MSTSRALEVAYGDNLQPLTLVEQLVTPPTKLAELYAKLPAGRANSLLGKTRQVRNRLDRGNRTGNASRGRDRSGCKPNDEGRPDRPPLAMIIGYLTSFGRASG